MAWELSSELAATQSPVVQEYVGGESGLIMIAGLLIIDAILVWRLTRRGG
jgi:hypothetical protein